MRFALRRTAAKEGPVVEREDNVYFTNIGFQHHRWNPKLPRLSLFLENSHKTNGLLFDADGNLLACEAETGRIPRTDMRTGKIVVLAGSFGGRPLKIASLIDDPVVIERILRHLGLWDRPERPPPPPPERTPCYDLCD